MIGGQHEVIILVIHIDYYDTCDCDLSIIFLGVNFAACNHLVVCLRSNIADGDEFPPEILPLVEVCDCLLNIPLM